MKGRVKVKEENDQKNEKKSKSKLRRLFSIDGNSYIGLFLRCTEDLVILPQHLSNGLVVDVERALGVKAVKTSIAETSLVGCLTVGNSNGFLFSQYTLDSEIQMIADFTKVLGLNLKFSRLPSEDLLNAAGNIILANDTVALVHPQSTEKTVDIVKETLEVEVYKSKIYGLKTVGMTAVATNKGVLVDKNAPYADLEFLEEIFGLPVGIGSVNCGVPVIGAALLANTKGYAVGDETTGAELGRITEVLGF